MIPFEFEYVRPTTAEDAARLYAEASSGDRSVRYLGGGTELVTMARDGKLRYDVLIDLKRIPETTGFDADNLAFGSCIRLSDLRDMKSRSPAGALISQAAGGVADRTTRNSITLGGNVCGMLPYREALLPFLVLKGQVTLQGPEGKREAPLAEVFDKRVALEPGEFVLSFQVEPSALEAVGYYRRHSRDSRVDYPLVTLCMARDAEGTRLAVSGAFAAPTLIAPATDAFESEFKTDMRASGRYRRALLERSIEDGLAALGETK